MAVIDEDIPVKFGDATLYFEDPGERSKLLVSAMSKSLKNEEKDEQDSNDDEVRSLLWGQLKRVENLKRTDGSDVTLESIRDGEDGKRRRFFRMVLRNYLLVMYKVMNGEDLAAKND